jgi:predicted O-linked N-acetylglucosamine transferase (SPINDLY family)
MHQWQPQAYEYLLQKDYARAINIYEQAIAEAPEIATNYFYLGLLQLLAGQEKEAQLTWIECINQEVSPEQIDVWTDDLIAILGTEIARQKDHQEYEKAWIISCYIHEIDPTNLNNSLMWIWLSIKLQRLNTESAILIEVIETLTINKFVEDFIKFNRNFLYEVIESLLKYEPYPLLAEFIEASLPFLSENIIPIYELLLKVSLGLALDKRRYKLAISILQLCLNFLPEHLPEYLSKRLLLLDKMSKIYLENNDYDKALEFAQSLCLLSKDIKDIKDNYFLNPSYTLTRILSMRGGYWKQMLSASANHESLIRNLIEAKPDRLPSPITRHLYYTNSFNHYVRDEPRLNRYLQNQIAQICQVSTNVDLTEQISKLRRRSRSRPSSHKLKIGYISKCMNSHSVGWLARWLIKYHDRAQVRLYGYFLFYHHSPDALQGWYESQMDQVYRVSNDNIADHSALPTTIAAKIDEDEIDILIDLDSITYDVSCAVMALKPAPIQITWLGCDASGIPTIDYFIADPYVLPDSAQEYYTEKIWRLPQAYIAVDGFEVGVPSLRRDQLNIPDDAVVYLTAQTASKRSPDTIRLQMQIIKAVPNSYFLIKGMGDQGPIKDFFIQIAIAENVNISSLRFLPITNTEAEHRANLAISDIVLDTYPYNGATTTLETLWMCIPIVTKVGEQFAARNSYTMMINAGISEGIAWTDAEYVEWGVRLGTDAALREDIATRLKASRQTSPLWNGEKFTREMENAYQQMWQQYILKETD